MKALRYLWLVVFIPSRLLRAPFIWVRLAPFKEWDSKLLDTVLVASFGLAVFIHWAFVFFYLVPLLLTASYLWGTENKKPKN